MSSRGRVAALFEKLGSIDREHEVHRDGTVFGGVELDFDICEKIGLLLGARDLSALGSCCRSLSTLAAQLYPGLKLTLYRHQRISLAFMMRREATAADCRGRRRL